MDPKHRKRIEPRLPPSTNPTATLLHLEPLPEANTRRQCHRERRRPARPPRPWVRRLPALHLPPLAWLARPVGSGYLHLHRVRGQSLDGLLDPPGPEPHARPLLPERRANLLLGAVSSTVHGRNQYDQRHGRLGCGGGCTVHHDIWLHLRRGQQAVEGRTALLGLLERFQQHVVRAPDGIIRNADDRARETSRWR